MPATIFCQHKRVWTTCPQCGKEVIDVVKKSLKSGPADDAEPARTKRPAEDDAAATPDETPEET